MAMRRPRESDPPVPRALPMFQVVAEFCPKLLQRTPDILVGLKDIIELAVRFQGSRGGVTLEDIQQDLSISRRTAERMRDAVEWAFGPLETVPTDDNRLHWRLQSGGRLRPRRRACGGDCTPSSPPPSSTMSIRRPGSPTSSTASPGRRRASSTNSSRGTGKTASRTIRPHRPRPPPGASSPEMRRHQTQPQIPRGLRRMLTCNPPGSAN